MPEAKLFEVRDAATFIPAVGVLMVASEGVHCAEWRHAETTAREEYLLGRAGYGEQRLVLFTRLDGGTPAEYDPHAWPERTRTMSVAHQYVTDNWNEMESGAVIDVEHILGLRSEPKRSEREEGF